jgi:hypothetical protein
MKTFLLKFLTVVVVMTVVGLPIFMKAQAISGDLLA